MVPINYRQLTIFTVSKINSKEDRYEENYATTRSYRRNSVNRYESNPFDCDDDEEAENYVSKPNYRNGNRYQATTPSYRRINKNYKAPTRAYAPKTNSYKEYDEVSRYETAPRYSTNYVDRSYKDVNREYGRVNPYSFQDRSYQDDSYLGDSYPDASEYNGKCKKQSLIFRLTYLNVSI